MENEATPAEPTQTPVTPPVPEPSPIPAPAPAPAQSFSANTLAVIQASAPGVREILSSVVNVSESGKYYEPSCKFCSSRNRDHAERMIETYDIAVKPHEQENRVSSFFTSCGEDISPDVVRNHIKVHMNRGDIEIRKAEYIGRLATLTGSGMTTLAQSKLAEAAILECLSSIGTIISGTGANAAKTQEIKASVVTKLVKTWIDLITVQAKLNGEMWDEGKMVAIPASDFQRVFDDALNSARTPDERRLIANILEGLTNSSQR